MARAATATRTGNGSTRRRGLVRLALVGVLCVIGAGYVSPAYNFYMRTNQIRDAQAVNSGLQETYDTLSIEKERLLADSYVEEMARRDLGLVKPGEKSFIVKDIQQDEAVTVLESEAGPGPPSLTDPGRFAASFPF